MNYKLTLRDISSDIFPEDLFEDTAKHYGATQGDVLVDATDKDKIEIVLKDVALGDAKALAEDIYRDYGDEDEYLSIGITQSEDGKHWFPVQEDD
jgi:hypothetical protein